MTPPLTIRNLTSTPLDLKLVERYEAPGTKKARCLGTLRATLVSPSSKKLAENAESFARQDVNIHLEPFRSQATDIKPLDREATHTLRLTIEADGQRYRIEPSHSHASQTFTPLVPGPKHQFTGIFFPKDSFLAVYSSAKLQCWMRELSDVTPLSGLSIPGTHNTPTCHRSLPSVRCQAVSPKEQLENGVRFFDIRVQPEDPEDASKDGLILVHGAFPISLTGSKHLRSLMHDIRDFLNHNVSETVIVSLKREGTGHATDQQLSMILHDHYATEDPSWWYTEPRIPKLGEVRGKLVLMRRFAIDDRLKAEHNGAGWGLDAEDWAYNTPDDTHGTVRVQDFCEVLETENIQIKTKYAEEHMARAAELVCPVPGITTDAVNPVPPGPLYLNFLSASNFWKVGCWPEKIAAKLNPAMIEYLCMKHHCDASHGDGSTGIVVCDWVGGDGDWDLVRCIVGMNSFLEMREKQLAA
ncbi:phosphatidylinositol phospholipase c [Diplodia corticola]|uniref:Phosphatidylinositol phospholipase c n=1 Tax=Diplodia corticola TaxID=236234 RepID=A0A1J9SD50_9PEZI|nr:phosphatidylinositol phospholipase c [Diplodia corticola]OJD37780.1 phosphatidylinositol phospholipase c [Diplodia corticola]